MNYTKVIQGEEIGLLTVIREIETDGKGTHVLCECSCPLRCHVVANLSALRRKGKNKSRKPSCGCLVNKPPFEVRRKIPDRILQGDEPYSMASEASRYPTTPRKKKKKQTPRSRVLHRIGVKTYQRLRRRYKKMIGVCYNPNYNGYKSYGAAGIKVCDLWLDPDQGFFEYLCFFIERVPKRNRGFIVRRKEKHLDFSPENCEVIIPAQEKTKAERLAQKPPSKLPLLVTFRGFEHGAAYEASFHSKYLGRYETPEEAEERLRQFFDETQNVSYDEYVKQREDKKHPLYRRWYLINQRYPKMVCSRWSKAKLGNEAFRNFLEDMDLNPDYDGRSLVRIDTKKPFAPSNTKWIRK